MKAFVAGFSVVYNAWLECFRSVLPGGSRLASQERSGKAAQAAADQGWEGEGGSIKPVKKPQQVPHPRIPS